jgi:hypothetical protein
MLASPRRSSWPKSDQEMVAAVTRARSAKPKAQIIECGSMNAIRLSVCS